MLGAVFDGSSINSTEFSKSSLEQAILSNVTFKSVDFNSCNLQESNFSNSSMSGLDLRTCDISGIITYANDIKGVILTSQQSLSFIKLLGITIID